MYRQLVYASTSTLENTKRGVGLEVGRILTCSKRNNSKLDVGGVLYMDNGYFLQVLEGDYEKVGDLYARIRQDDRHEDVKVLLDRMSSKALFSRWRMNYVIDKKGIRQSLNRVGQKNFNPYELNSIDVEKLVVSLANPSFGSSKDNHSEKGRWLDRLWYLVAD